MKFLEKNLEDIVFQTENKDLQERDLEIEGVKLRQTFIGNYGTSDIITFEKPRFITEEERKINKTIPDRVTHTRPVITIYELKKDEINKHTFLQAVRYLKGVDRFLTIRNVSMIGESFFDYRTDRTEQGIEFKIVLIGSNLATDSSSYIPDFFNVDFYTYEYKFDGLYFNQESGYRLMKEGFKLEDNED